MTMLEVGKQLLCEIVDAGHDAYIVGGTVRDMMMGKTDIHDVDIATNMPIEKIKKAYNTVEYGGGEKHGTVIVVYNGFSFELTQFRCDGSYTDGRRPDSVTFVNDFKTDCSRRDFTINAMGMDSSECIVDFFDGYEHIQSRMIKTVGNAHDRFEEDALRMIRAFRFAARGGFEVDSEIFKAVFELKHNIKNVSKERVRDEFEKTISYGGIAFAKFIHLMHFKRLPSVKRSSYGETEYAEVDHRTGFILRKTKTRKVFKEHTMWKFLDTGKMTPSFKVEELDDADKAQKLLQDKQS